MKIEYVCHACLFIDTGSVKIATDPWFVGPAYCGQWYVYPRPVNTDVLADSDVVLLSHGHEDHFHEPSLRAMPKSARVLFPYSWYGGTKPFLQELGFASAVEALPQKRYQLASDTSVTYIVNGMDSIVVVESKGKVLVNINDALHSYPPKIIDLFVNFLCARWPVIDTLFCGFGGASYFPNTLHCPGKNDLEIGQAREQLFAHNFCRIVHGMKPRVAVPFAADFALLSPAQRWINDVRFPRTSLAEYYRQLYGSNSDTPRIEVMYSGDVLENSELKASSPYRNEVHDNELIDRQYGPEIAASNRSSSTPEENIAGLEHEIAKNLEFRRRLFREDTLEKLKFTVKIVDAASKPYFNLSFVDGSPVVRRDGARAAESILQIDVSSRILRYSFASDWGGDAITIGYGCDIQVFDQSTVAGSLDTACVRLLTRQPQASNHWRTEPVRVVKHLLTSPTTRTWVAKSVLGRSSDYSDKKTNDVMRQWLFRSKCEVCRACDLPLMDESFAARL